MIIIDDWYPGTKFHSLILSLGSFLSFRICCIISGLRAKNDGWYQNTVSATVT